MKTGKQEIPRRPLLWIAAGLAFTVPPMLGTLNPWVWGCFAISILSKFWMARRGLRLRSFLWKATLAGIALGGVELTYHTLGGLESALSLFLLLTSLKVLEAHTARDFHILALLGWLLCLAGLFISQDLLAGIYAATGFILILAAVAQYHRGPASRRPLAGPLLTSARLVLQALPVVIVLFFLFPRLSPFQFQLKRPRAGSTGMSNELKPGSVGSLALSSEVAFRAEFPDGEMPAPGDLYWRGSVLTWDNGFVWTSSRMDATPRPPEHLGTVAIRQRIIVQPHGGQWIFALEWPGVTPANTTRFWGDVLRADKPIFNQWHYEVTSNRGNRQSELSRQEFAASTQLPWDISPRVRDLARSWKAHAPDERAIIASAMEYFHKEKFIYTLTPGQYGEKDGLDDFLFRRRSGFCEHYAAAFATLMRLAGIPSRVVIGYHGGQFNALGKYLVVRQSDAHAWCEVWLRGVGWQRADPTASVAGDNVNGGFVDMRTTAAPGAHAAVGPGAGGWGGPPFLRNIQLAWDAVSYEWDSRVANFDDETQQSFFLGLGWPDTSPSRLVAWLAAAAACLLGAQALWTRWRTRVPRDPLKTRYERFCRRLSVLGVKREPWEGPSRFAERATASLPAHAERIRRVAEIYVSLRYAEDAGELERAREMKEFDRMARV